MTDQRPLSELPGPLVSILIPTTGRRDTLLRKVSRAFRLIAADEGYTIEVLTIVGHSWGEGLNQLAARARGRYWLTICDDTLPHPGWFPAARATVDAGLTPATRYFNTDGTPLQPSDAAPHGQPVAWCRSFLLTPHLYDQTGPFLDLSWWADIEYSERLRDAGREIVACDGFSFTHLGGERDWLTAAEEDRQRRVYEDAQRARGVR